MRGYTLRKPGRFAESAHELLGGTTRDSHPLPRDEHGFLFRSQMKAVSGGKPRQKQTGDLGVEGQVVQPAPFAEDVDQRRRAVPATGILLVFAYRLNADDL